MFPDNAVIDVPGCSLPPNIRADWCPGWAAPSDFISWLGGTVGLDADLSQVMP